MHAVCENSREEMYWTDIFNTLFLKEKLNSWAYPWMFTCWANSSLAILPNVNLVSNIGFEANATHTQDDSSLANLSTQHINEIKHPTFIVQDKNADFYTFARYYHPSQGKLTLLLNKLISQAKSLGKIAQQIS